MNTLLPNELVQEFLQKLFTIEALWVMAAVYVTCEALYALPRMRELEGTTKQAVASVLGAIGGFLLLPVGGIMAVVHGLILGFATTKLVARFDKYFGTKDEIPVNVKSVQQ